MNMNLSNQLNNVTKEIKEVAIMMQCYYKTLSKDLCLTITNIENLHVIFRLQNNKIAVVFRLRKLDILYSYTYKSLENLSLFVYYDVLTRTERAVI